MASAHRLIGLERSPKTVPPLSRSLQAIDCRSRSRSRHPGATASEQTATAIVSTETIRGRILLGIASANELEEASRAANLVVRCLNALGLKGGKRGDPLSLERYLAAKRKREGDQ